jgi:hypothetical protein
MAKTVRPCKKSKMLPKQRMLIPSLIVFLTVMTPRYTAGDDGSSNVTRFSYMFIL